MASHRSRIEVHICLPPPSLKVLRVLTDWIVDTVLEDCFQLISLSFMTIGRNNEAPALYVLTSVFVSDSANKPAQICLVIHFKGITSIGIVRDRPLIDQQRLLDHLKEAGFYSAKDLGGLDKKIVSMRESLRRGTETYSPHLITLLSNRLDVCQTALNELKASIPRLCSSMSPQYEKLVSILRSMAAANTRTIVSCYHRRV